MAINTKEKLVQYIRMQLGEPILRVEVTDPQIEMIIDETVDKFTEYCWEGELEKVLLLEINGMGTYTFPEEVKEIITVRSESGAGSIMSFGSNFGAGYVPDVWSQQYFSAAGMGSIMTAMISVSSMQAISEKYFEDEVNYRFSAGKNALQIMENFKGIVLVHYFSAYVPDDVDYIFNHPWVKEYALNKTKFLWGNNTGKYSQSLVGGATINYGDFKSEAESVISRLEEELLTKYTDPAPIDVA